MGDSQHLSELVSRSHLGAQAAFAQIFENVNPECQSHLDFSQVTPKQKACKYHQLAKNY